MRLALEFSVVGCGCPPPGPDGLDFGGRPMGLATCARTSSRQYFGVLDGLKHVEVISAGFSSRLSEISASRPVQPAPANLPDSSGEHSVSRGPRRPAAKSLTGFGMSRRDYFQSANEPALSRHCSGTRQQSKTKQWLSVAKHGASGPARFRHAGSPH